MVLNLEIEKSIGITTELRWRIEIELAKYQTQRCKPIPYFELSQNFSSALCFLAGTTIIDTHSLKPPDYCVLTGRNGSNVVGLYRYKVEYTGWIGLNTTLGGVGWAFDIQRKWSTAAITVNPWTRILYIVYLYSNMLVFRQYPMIDTLFDSNSATGTAFQFTLARVVPRPQFVLHWADNSTLFIGIHSHSQLDVGLQPNFVLGEFHVNDTSIVQALIHIDQHLMLSMEFGCSTCSVNKY
ncbi:hypothetical protein BKA69DRAFT_895760 [Paraphysoderma sedebokerense]|nr:hypothetical protein BKA69DRAFT_895760 [Paraphysoderma sedebokerense]